MGVHNPEIAEEIAQETFMRIWRGAHFQKLAILAWQEPFER